MGVAKSSEDEEVEDLQAATPREEECDASVTGQCEGASVLCGGADDTPAMRAGSQRMSSPFRLGSPPATQQQQQSQQTFSAWQLRGGQAAELLPLGKSPSTAGATSFSLAARHSSAATPPTSPAGAAGR